MNPPNKSQSLPERVAVLETDMETLKTGMFRLVQIQDRQDGLLNTVSVSMATLVTKLQTVIDERSRWKDPTIYITALSVMVALYAVWSKH